MDHKEKILVCGDVRGQFKYLFNRVETINKKNGPFELLLCVGEFFGENNDELIAYRNGFKNVPIPTYILGPNSEKYSELYANLMDNEICTNLTYLGRRGLYSISSGLKLAYVSGRETESEKLDEWSFNKEDIVSVKNSCFVNKKTMGDYRGVDILITSQWPHGISDSKDIEVKNPSTLVSWLAREIKPRYHFCGLNNVYYERKPYRNTMDNNTQMELATRFIGLAHVNTDKNPKTKFIYALSVTPVDKMRVIDLIQKTTDETVTPYGEINFGKLMSNIKNIDNNDTSSNQYFYDMQSYDKKRKNHSHDGKHFKRQPRTFDQEKCWFCLSSQNVEKHLIISIGDNFYLALAKGPINEYHVLILSITHIQSCALLSAEDWAELEKFKTALRQFYKSLNMVALFYERNYKSSHLQINAIPFDESLAWQLKHIFTDKSDEYNMQFETVPKLTEPSELPDKSPYFMAELPDDSVLITKQMKNFPLHFGREIVCSENLLNMEQKIDWKECELAKDEEIELVKRFREAYKEFDFTL